MKPMSETKLCHHWRHKLERQIASHYYERYMLSGDTKESNIPIVGEEDCHNSRFWTPIV